MGSHHSEVAERAERMHQLLRMLREAEGEAGVPRKVRRSIHGP